MVTLITSLYIFFKVATCQLYVFENKIIIKSTLFDTIVILAIHDLFATYDDAQVYGVGLFALLACTSLMISPIFIFVSIIAERISARSRIGWCLWPWFRCGGNISGT